MAAHSGLRTQLRYKESAAQVWCFAWTKLHWWKGKHWLWNHTASWITNSLPKLVKASLQNSAPCIIAALIKKSHLNECVGISGTFFCPNTKSRPTPLCNLLQNPKSLIILLEMLKLHVLHVLSVFWFCSTNFPDYFPDKRN